MTTFSTLVSLALSTYLFQGGQALPIAPTSDLQKAFVNPALWNAAPIIDWDKFYAQDPDSKVSMVYDLPQRYGKGTRMVSLPLIGERYEKNMDFYFVDEARTLTPEEIAVSGKPNAAKISEDLFDKLLAPAPDSSKVAKPFRNKLFWMEHNHMMEELLSFNRWAWRSQCEGDGRAIAVGNLQYDWTNDGSRLGSFVSSQSVFLSIQESPCKKYYKIATFMGPNISWLTMYIIQEGDELVHKDGTPVPDISPGDVLRLTYGDGLDPYECDPDKLEFTYLFRTIATYNEETGKVEKDPTQYENIMAKINAPLPVGLDNVSHLTHIERYDLSRKSVCDLQIYKPAPVPPTGDEIENL